MSDSANAANTPIMISAAPVITPAVCFRPYSTAPSVVPVSYVALAHAREQEHLVVDRQAEHDPEDRQHHDRVDLARAAERRRPWNATVSTPSAANTVAEVQQHREQRQQQRAQHRDQDQVGRSRRAPSTSHQSRPSRLGLEVLQQRRRPADGDLRCRCASRSARLRPRAACAPDRRGSVGSPARITTMRAASPPRSTLTAKLAPTRCCVWRSRRSPRAAGSRTGTRPVPTEPPPERRTPACPSAAARLRRRTGSASTRSQLPGTVASRAQAARQPVGAARQAPRSGRQRVAARLQACQAAGQVAATARAAGRCRRPARCVPPRGAARSRCAARRAPSLSSPQPGRLVPRSILRHAVRRLCFAARARLAPAPRPSRRRRVRRRPVSGSCRSGCPAP